MSLYGDAKRHFVDSHKHPVNQALHHLVNVIAIVGLIWVAIDWRISVICLILTQIFALSGHAFFEKNKPAFIKYPVLTILASFSWSFENGFGIRTLLASMARRSRHV